jgi:hypothetical protein
MQAADHVGPKILFDLTQEMEGKPVQNLHIGLKAPGWVRHPVSLAGLGASTPPSRQIVSTTQTQCIIQGWVESRVARDETHRIPVLTRFETGRSVDKARFTNEKVIKF